VTRLLRIRIGLTAEVGGSARLNHGLTTVVTFMDLSARKVRCFSYSNYALTGMVTVTAVTPRQRDHGRETVVRTGAAPNFGREPDCHGTYPGFLAKTIHPPARILCKSHGWGIGW
jgi:hypothetical protein